MQEKRVVVTGMGTVNPLGNSVKETWAAILARKSGISGITRFDASKLACQIAGEVKNFDFADYYPEEMRKNAKRMDLFCHYAAAAMKEAADHAGLQSIADRNRIGISVGSGIGGHNVQHENSVALATKGAAAHISQAFRVGSHEGLQASPKPAWDRILTDAGFVAIPCVGVDDDGVELPEALNCDRNCPADVVRFSAVSLDRFRPAAECDDRFLDFMCGGFTRYVGKGHRVAFAHKPLDNGCADSPRTAEHQRHLSAINAHHKFLY